MTDLQQTQHRSPLFALGWAVFLGVSWTWVIGMWLPVILLRDFGRHSFLIFAIPNCLGAAAMGWVIASPAASRAFLARHAQACKLFSWVTFSFQVFVLLQLWPGQMNLSTPSSEGFWESFSVALPIGVVLVCATKRVRRSSIGPGLAYLVLAVSMAIGIYYFANHDPALITRNFQPEQRPPLDSVGLAAVCMFGFILCPYLDPTFHQARMQLPSVAEGRFAFTVGFCVIFASMIGLTFAYGWWELVQSSDASRITPADMPRVIALHLGVQVLFKLLAHGGFLTGPPVGQTRTLRLGSILVAFGIGGLLEVIQSYLHEWDLLHEIGFSDPRFSSFEVIYRGFLSWYGLIFPAYVWLCSCPIGGFSAGPVKRNIFVLALACVAAAPFYGLAFFGNNYYYAIVGVLIVLGAKLLTKRVGSERNSSDGDASARPPA